VKQPVVVVPETAPAQPYKRTVIDTKKAAAGNDKKQEAEESKQQKGK
jgi:hypothetical protein